MQNKFYALGAFSDCRKPGTMSRKNMISCSVSKKDSA
jgi:hypothetical protein